MINNLIDYRTAPRLPTLTATNSTSSTVLELLQWAPYHIGPGQFLGSMRRALSIIPWIRTTNALYTATIVVTSSLTPPAGDSNASVLIPGPSRSVQFTTSSSSWTRPTAQELSMVFNARTGISWLIVEAKISNAAGACEFRGFAERRLVAR